ncbi:MAG: hypothetical protein OSJ45_15605 [Lachnospiraceae bacterium]|nr:hypothetical protein [Lachnospiraceae bacterium]
MKEFLKEEEDSFILLMNIIQRANSEKRNTEHWRRMCMGFG